MATADAVDDGRVFKGGKFSDRAHQHGLSDELIDPWCDLCFDKTNKKIKASGFCPECNKLLCKPCLDAHKMFPVMENHTILQGERMPKTQADRPVKYFGCNIHKGYVNDHFCMDHCKMVCSHCIFEFHKACKQEPIPDLCADLDPIHIQNLRNATETIKKDITFVKNIMEQNKDNMNIQNRKRMIKDANELHNNLVSKIANAYSITESHINIACDKKVSHLSTQVFALSDMQTFLDKELCKIDKVSGGTITPHAFLQLQKLVENVRQSQIELADLNKELRKEDLSFSASAETSAFLSANNPLGRVKEDSAHLNIMMATPEIAFPSPSRNTNKSKTQTGRIAKDIMKMKTTKMTPLGVIMTGDKQPYDISGMIVTRNNLLLLADRKNKKVKVFSPENKLLSSLALPGQPYDIIVIDDATVAVSVIDDTTTGASGIDDTTAAVRTAHDGKLLIVDISDPASFAIQSSVSLGYLASSVAACNNNLVGVNWTEPRSVKMFTMTGADLWTKSIDHNGQKLFENPRSVRTNIINDKLTVIATDLGKDTITLLDANNGDVIKIVDVKEKKPRGLTVDNDGNVYVCCYGSREICVWSNDFSQSRVLLSASDLQPKLQDVVYRNSTDEIFVCYYATGTVDHFKLS